MDELEEFLKVIEALHAAGVRFVIIGGVAMRLQGCSHITDDIDVCYSRDRINLSTLVAALSPHRTRLRGAPADLPFIFDTRTLQFGLNFT